MLPPWAEEGSAYRNEAPVSASSGKDHWVGFAADVLMSSFASCFRASLACWRRATCSILNAKGDSLRRRWEGNFAGASAPLVLNVLLDHL